MTDAERSISFSDADLAAMAGSRGVLARTDAGRADALIVVRRAGAQPAAALGTTLFLADRSQRTHCATASRSPRPRWS